ncbi:MAG: cation:proton antiporter regulatory subunit [Iamia sp.]
MAEVTEVKLPGVGVRLDLTTEGGSQIGVVVHHTGRREMVVYDAADPDRCVAQIALESDDAHVLAEMLGATEVTEIITAVQQQVEGLAIEWVTIGDGSPFVGRTIGEGEFRTRTGTSIVAAIRGETTIPAPGPDHRFESGETIVAVGTAADLVSLADLIEG